VEIDRPLNPFHHFSRTVWPTHVASLFARHEGPPYAPVYFFYKGVSPESAWSNPRLKTIACRFHKVSGPNQFVPF
jgi:hypothetical protein